MEWLLNNITILLWWVSQVSTSPIFVAVARTLCQCFLVTLHTVCAVWELVESVQIHAVFN